MSSPDGGPQRTVAEIDFNQASSTSAKIGNRTIHQFWHLFSAQFRGVLLAPQRRPESGKVSWVWREPSDPRPFTVPELAEVRRRLTNGNRSLAGGLMAADLADEDENGGRSVDAQVRASVSAMVGGLLGLSDQALSGYVCRTETGPMLHSWGAATPAKPYVPDSQQGEVTGTVLVDGERTSGITVVLENAQGAKVGRARSDSGGSFAFHGVEPGEYRLRVADRTDFPAQGLAIAMEREGLTGLELRGGREPSASAASGGARRSWRWLRYPAWALLAVALAGGGVWYYRQRPEKVAAKASRSSGWQSAPSEQGTGAHAADAKRPVNGEPGWTKLTPRASLPEARRGTGEVEAAGGATKATLPAGGHLPSAGGDAEVTMTERLAEAEAKPETSAEKAESKEASRKVGHVILNVPPERTNSSQSRLIKDNPPHPVATLSTPSQETVAEESRADTAAKPGDAAVSQPEETAEAGAMAGVSAASAENKRAEADGVSSVAKAAGGTAAEKNGPEPQRAPQAAERSGGVTAEAGPAHAERSDVVENGSGVARPDDVQNPGPASAEARADSGRGHSAGQGEAQSSDASASASTDSTRPEAGFHQARSPAEEKAGATEASRPSALGSASDEAGLVSVRIVLGEWSVHLVADRILPTQPVLAKAGSVDVVALKTKMWAAQRERRPAWMESPRVSGAVIIELPNEAVVAAAAWSAVAARGDLVATAIGRRAEIRWTGTRPAAGADYCWRDSAGRVLAGFNTDATGALILKLADGVRAWYRVEVGGVGASASEAMPRWQFFPSGEVPADWERGGAGRLTMPLAVRSSGEVSQALALVDADSGWALTGRITFR